MSEREEPKFFSVAEISNMLRISQSRTYELLAADTCPFNVIKIGKRICIPANSFYKWYESLAGEDNAEGGIVEE